MPEKFYKITSFDKSIAEIAARFHIADLRQIADENQAIFPTGGEDLTAPLAPSMVGQLLQLPLPDDDVCGAREWGQYVAAGGESLAAVCSKMNKDRRIDPSGKGKGVATPPWLTPDYLLNLFENQNVRGAHGADASSVQLSVGEVVAVPFPAVKTRARVLRTTPDAPTTFSVDPPWLYELTTLYESIRGRARRFEEQVVALRAVQREGVGEATRLVEMRRVLEVLTEHPKKPKELLRSEMGELGPVRTAISNAHNTLIDKLCTHVLEVERPDALAKMNDLGQGLLDSLRSAHFCDLAKQLRTNASRYSLRVNELCAALGYAYQVLFDSDFAEEAAKDVEAAVKYAAGVKPVKATALKSVDQQLASQVESIASAPPPDSALGVMTTLVRNIGGLVTSSVGNLPGPSSLAVALFRLYAVAQKAKFLLAGRVVTTVEIDQEASVLIAFARNTFASDDAEGEEIMIAIAEVRTAVKVGTRVESIPNKVAILNRIDGEVGDAVMIGARWTAGMTIAGVFVLVFSIADMWRPANGEDHNFNVTDGTAAVGGAVIVALGIVRLFGSKAAISVAGRLSAGIGVVLAGYQWYADAKAGNDTTADKLGTVGSALLALSLIPEPFSPVLAVAGGVLVVASIAYSLFEDDGVRNLFRTGAKRWFLVQTRQIREGAHFKIQQGTLEPSVKALEDAVLAADFFDVDLGQHDFLMTLVGTEDQVNLLLGK